MSRYVHLNGQAASSRQVAMTQYVGVVTIVLAKHSIREAITSVETSERGIGLLGFGVSHSIPVSVEVLANQKGNKAVSQIFSAARSRQH